MLRFGWSLLGTTNHPAAPDATGLEVDKYDGAAVRRYFDHYLDTYAGATGTAGKIDALYAYAVFKGDEFRYSLGLKPTLEHVPGGNKNNATVLDAEGRFLVTQLFDDEGFFDAALDVARGIGDRDRPRRQARRHERRRAEAALERRRRQIQSHRGDVRVERDEVLLDIGYKSEGVIPARVEAAVQNGVDVAPRQFACVLAQPAVGVERAAAGLVGGRDDLVAGGEEEAAGEFQDQVEVVHDEDVVARRQQAARDPSPDKSSSPRDEALHLAPRPSEESGAARKSSRPILKRRTYSTMSSTTASNLPRSPL